MLSLLAALCPVQSCVIGLLGGLTRRAGSNGSTNCSIKAQAIRRGLWVRLYAVAITLPAVTDRVARARAGLDQDVAILFAAFDALRRPNGRVIDDRARAAHERSALTQTLVETPSSADELARPLSSLDFTFVCVLSPRSVSRSHSIAAAAPESRGLGCEP